MLPELYRAKPIEKTPYDDVFYFIRGQTNGPCYNHYTFLDWPGLSVLCLKFADQIRIKKLRNDKQRQKVRDGYGDIQVIEIQLPSALAFAQVASIAIESRHERKKLENIVSSKRTLEGLITAAKAKAEAQQRFLA